MPQQVFPGADSKPVVKFNIAGKSAIIGLGQAGANVHLAFVGTKIVVIYTDTYWKICLRP